MSFSGVSVFGGGLAGSEAAWQCAERGLSVRLYEMRPRQATPAHTTDRLAELVCSNSFGSLADHSASRMLKDELTSLKSLVLQCARESAVPAGASLAVDRNVFADKVTSILSSHPRIEIVREEAVEIPTDSVAVIATGPLTSASLAAKLEGLLGQRSLYFYDAISPIVSHDSLDLDKMFYANRYDRGETKDFLNIPLTQAQYETFVSDLLSGDVVLPHAFEEEKYFEGCMPIEAIAARGPRTLAFGPMKPAGLPDPKTGRWAHAVIQLRAENRDRTAYNLVGFQTKLKYPEQIRIFKKLPGLENAEFLRLGSMHRNTYLDSPRHLTSGLQLRVASNVFIAGQLTGTEGYLESVATGLVAGIGAAHRILGREGISFPRETMLGALLANVSDPEKAHFQPMNSNFGILPGLGERKFKDKKVRNQAYSERAHHALTGWLQANSISV